MKKFTLTLMAMFLMLTGTTGFAANQVATTFDGEWTPALPTKNVQEESTHTAPNGTEWVIFNGKLNTYGDAANLYLAKQSGYIILPKVDFPVGNIVVTSGEGSISFTAEIGLFIGKEENGSITWEEEPVDTKVTAEAATDYTFLLSNQEAGVRYKLAATNSKNAQVMRITINEASADPSLSFSDESDVVYGTGLNGTQTKAVKVVAENLSSDIEVAISGDNATMFAADVNTLPAAGGDINITYTGSTAGAANAILTISNGSLTKSLNLTATTVERAGTAADPLNLSDVVALNNTTEGEFWVKGAIKGCATQTSETNLSGIAEENVESNIALGEDGLEVTVPVELKSGSDIREALNLVANPSNLNKEVYVYGSLELYFGRTGIKNLTAYSWEDPSSISTATAEGVSIYAADGVVYVTAPAGENITVMNIAGQVVANIQADGGKTAISNLPANQLLLVKAGNQVAKVVR